MAISIAAASPVHALEPRGVERGAPTTNDAAPPDWQAARNDIPPYPDCLGHPLAYCIVVHGRGKRVLLLGDSLARMWLPALRKIAARDSLTLAVGIDAACPWPRQLHGLSSPTSCDPHREDWYKRIVPQYKPDLVFLANRAYDAPGNTLSIRVNGRPTPATDPRVRQVIETRMAASVKALNRAGRRIVLLEPTPLPVDRSWDPIDCLAAGLPDCSFTVSAAPTPLTEYERHLATGPDVWSVDLDKLVCPRFPVCDPIVDGKIVRRDHTHLTGTFAAALNPKLETLLGQQHILAPA